MLLKTGRKITLSGQNKSGMSDVADSELIMLDEARRMRDRAKQQDAQLRESIESMVAPSSMLPHIEVMESRVASLEAHMQHVQSDLTELKVGQKELAGAVSDLRVQMANDRADMFKAFADQSEKISKVATKGTVWTALATGGGIAVAVLGVFIAILTYLQAFPHSH